MSTLVMILALFAGLVLEQVWPAAFLTGFSRPPFLALVVAYYALNHSMPAMLAAALLGGFAADCVGALPPGVTTLAAAAAGAALFFSRETVFGGKLMANVFCGAAVGAGVTVITFALLLLSGRTFYSVQLPVLLLKFAASVCYGAFFFPAVYALMKKLEVLTGVIAIQNDVNPDN